jgi:hypothetical protein
MYEYHVEASLERTMEDWVIDNRCNRLFKVVEDVINYLFKLFEKNETENSQTFQSSLRPICRDAKSFGDS